MDNTAIKEQLESLYTDLAYRYGEEIESLMDDEEREEKLNQLDEEREQFLALLSQLN